MQSRTKKILIGIALVIGGLAVAFVGLIVGFIIWLGQPTPLADTALLVSTDTTGYAQLSLDPEDPGTVAFLDRFQEAGQESATEQNEGPADMFTRGSLSEALPIVAAWTMTPDPGQPNRGLNVGMISLPLFGRWLTIADGFFGLVGGGSDDFTSVRYEDERIYDVRTRGFGGAAFLREGTLFLTNDVGVAQSVVDLLAAESGTGTPSPSASPIGPLLDEADRNAPFHGAIVNGNGELLRLWETVSGSGVPPQVPLENVEGIHFSGALTELGGLEARATVVAASTDWTDVQVAAVQGSLERILEDTFGESEVTVERDGSNLTIMAAVPDLAEGLVRLGNEAGTQ